MNLRRTARERLRQSISHSGNARRTRDARDPDFAVARDRLTTSTPPAPPRPPPSLKPPRPVRRSETPGNCLFTRPPRPFRYDLAMPVHRSTDLTATSRRAASQLPAPAFRTDTRAATVHRRARHLGVLTLLALAACNDTAKPRTIDSKREIQIAEADLHLRASQQQRFGLRSMGSANAPGANAPGANATDDAPALAWDLPAGWTEKPLASMRQANFQLPGDPTAECYVTILGGEAGGLTANVNRWRTQMHLAALSAEEIAALPKSELFGRQATLVDFSGDFAGMNATEKLANQRLVALALVEPGGSVFLKMTGPAGVIGEQIDEFVALAKSFRFKPRERDPHAGFDPHSGVDPHAGLDPRSVGDGAMTPPPPSGTTSTANKAGGIAWTPPAGWTRAPDRSTRLCSFMVDGKDDLQCYITVLAGDAGGPLANVNRWRKQLGRDDLSEKDLAALPQGKMLGVNAVLVEIEGKTSADSTTSNDALLLGAVCVRPSGSVFVKLSGPNARVAAQRGAFRQFCASLVEAP